MSNTLLVPIALDALYLDKNKSVLSEMTDYSKLPYNYSSGGESVNPNRGKGYLSETVLSPPFTNLNLTLPKGIHLHWSLPEALTTGIAESDGITFPLVPNRWLIIRRGGGKPEKQWVVESDYLYPEIHADARDIPANTINILHQPASGESAPFRFLGRKWELGAGSAQWPSGSANARYVKALTAIGPFEKVEGLDNEKAGFAGFYPNCRSVFGFHDSEIAGNVPPQGLQYDVIGWYSDRSKDCLEKFLGKHSGTSAQDLVVILEEEFGWKITLPSGQNFPNSLLCHASIKFEPDSSLSDPAETLPNPKIAVGNNPEEAIAAYLASQLDQNNKENRKIIEQQLEALQLRERLAHQKLDFEARFREAVHENGFVGFTKEQLWRIVPESNQIASANALQEQAQAWITLPDELGAELDELNKLQHEYDRKLAEIGSIRELVYADWYKHMLARYVHNPSFLKKKPSGWPSNDQETIKFFVEVAPPPSPTAQMQSSNQYGLIALEEEIAKAGMLELRADDQDEITGASAINATGTAIATRLAQSINTLIANLDKFHKSSRAIAADGSKLIVENRCTLVADTVAGKCLHFNGQTDYFKVSGLRDICAVSMWVKIPDGMQGWRYLIDIRNSLDQSWVASGGIGTVWEKMYVNGEEKPLSWGNIPKNQWFFLYLQSKNQFSGTVHLMSRFNLQDYLPGDLASVQFHTNSLYVEEIRQIYGEKIGLACPSFLLKITAGPRYWQPSDPVILMTGDAVKPTGNLLKNAHFWEEGSLDCQLLQESIVWTNFPKNYLTILKQTLDALFNEQPRRKIGFYDWKNQPWNPFLLEWAVQFFPLQSGQAGYSSKILENHYKLAVNAIDLSLKSTTGTNPFTNPVNQYNGASFLSASSRSFLEEDLVDYLSKHLLPDYYAALSIPSDQQTEDYFSKNFAAIKKWYKPRDPMASDPIYTALRTYEQIRSPDFNCLAQSLSGFNDALLTYHRVMQLDVKDPLASETTLPFVEKIGAGLVKASRFAPDSLLRSPLLNNHFNPLRAGAMKIAGLRIIDTFGQVKVVVDITKPEETEVVTSQPLKPPSNCPYPVHFPPRLSQPARLNARWLAAAQQKREMNDHPVTSPICGWVLPNNLDSSLTIYDSEGFALGYLDRTVTWRPIPGETVPTAINAIANPYLGQMVSYLIARGSPFFLDFLTTINASLETIDPDTFAQNQAISLLIARPLALVRARVDLGLQGVPAVSQNIDDFSADIFTNKTRTTRNFPKIEFPVRVGDYRQFNDGLIGYWVETKDGYKDNRFFAPQSCYVKNPLIQTLFDSATDTTPDTPINLIQTLEADSALTLALLIDPRAQVNFTCGVLPAKRISLPPEQYLPALQQIEITFLSAPVLSALDQIYLSLPDVSDYAWSWLEKQGEDWSSQDLHPFYAQTIFSSRQKIHEGWLKLSQENTTHE